MHGRGGKGAAELGLARDVAKRDELGSDGGADVGAHDHENGAAHSDGLCGYHPNYDARGGG